MARTCDFNGRPWLQRPRLPVGKLRGQGRGKAGGTAEAGADVNSKGKCRKRWTVPGLEAD